MMRLKSLISYFIDTGLILSILVLMITLMVQTHSHGEYLRIKSASESMGIIQILFDVADLETIQEFTLIDHIDSLPHRMLGIYNEDLEKILPPQGSLIVLSDEEKIILNSSTEGSIHLHETHERARSDAYFQWVDTKFGKLLVLYCLEESYVEISFIFTICSLTIILVMIIIIRRYLIDQNLYIRMMIDTQKRTTNSFKNRRYDTIL